MLLLVTLLSGSAQAVELDLRVALPDAEPVALTLRQAASSPLPTLHIDGEQGHSYRVATTLAERDGGASYLVAFTIEQVTVNRRGREKTRPWLAPSLLVVPNQDASFHTGRLAPSSSPDAAPIKVDMSSIELHIRTAR